MKNKIKPKCLKCSFLQDNIYKDLVRSGSGVHFFIIWIWLLGGGHLELDPVIFSFRFFQDVYFSPHTEQLLQSIASKERLFELIYN